MSVAADSPVAGIVHEALTFCGKLAALPGAAVIFSPRGRKTVAANRARPYFLYRFGTW
jgi:hypothetical protein